MFCTFIGSAAPAKITVASKKEAQKLLDEVNERCSMTYRAPELFNIDIDSVIDERIDIWVSYCYLLGYLLNTFNGVKLHICIY